MPDGTVYVVASYALTALVLVGYAVRLALRGRSIRRRRGALMRAPDMPAGASTRRAPAREPSHV